MVTAQKLHIRSDYPIVADHARDMHFEFSVSTQEADPEWDNFVQLIPHGHHTQSSLWSQLKSLHNWKPLRLTASKDGQIAAGIQILLKPLPLFGVIGYAPNGPVFRTSDAALQKQLLEQLNQLVKTHRIRMLFVHPPRCGEDFVPLLKQFGYRLNEPSIAVDATVMLDLEPDLDEIIKGFTQKKRYNVRYAGRKGVTIRECSGREDLALFHRLLSASAERQGFTPESLEYFEKMYELFEPGGHIKILFAEHDNEPLAARLVIGYGDTVIMKRVGFSGEKSNLHPNEAVEWAAIEWAKAQGYRYYDLEGLDRKTAAAVLAGEPLPAEAVKSPDRYKLDHGGEVRLLPQTYTYIRNPLVAWLYYTAYPRVADSSLFDSILRIFRRSSGRGDDR